MPEGPSIVILREEVAHFTGQEVLEADGNAKIAMGRLKGQAVERFASWGKQFLICFNGFYLRVHLLLFGSYRIDEDREMKPRLRLQFPNGALSFYSCSVRLLEGSPDDVYDWEKDTLSDQWNPAKALRAVRASEERMVCDVLMDQDIFAGSGNIVKNEVLFRLRVHPESLTGALPEKLQQALVQEVRDYCFDFYRWKKAFVLKKHWQIFRQAKCPLCGNKVIRRATGKGNRLSFFCEHDQKLYGTKVRRSRPLKMRSVMPKTKMQPKPRLAKPAPSKAKPKPRAPKPAVPKLRKPKSAN